MLKSESCIKQDTVGTQQKLIARDFCKVKVFSVLGRSRSGLLRTQVCSGHLLFTIPFWKQPPNWLDRHKDMHMQAKQRTGNYPTTEASREGEKSGAPLCWSSTYRGEVRRGARTLSR